MWWQLKYCVLFSPLGKRRSNLTRAYFSHGLVKHYHLVMTMCLCAGFHDGTSNHNDDNDAYQIIRMINLLSRVVAVVTIILISQKWYGLIVLTFILLYSTSHHPDIIAIKSSTITANIATMTIMTMMLFKKTMFVCDNMFLYYSFHKHWQFQGLMTTEWAARMGRMFQVYREAIVSFAKTVVAENIFAGRYWVASGSQKTTLSLPPIIMVNGSKGESSISKVSKVSIFGSKSSMLLFIFGTFRQAWAWVFVLGTNQILLRCSWTG